MKWTPDRCQEVRSMSRAEIRKVLATMVKRDAPRALVHCHAIQFGRETVLNHKG